MALILDGNGLIQGLDAGGLPSGSVNADTLASTLDLSSKTMTFGNVSASGITFPASVSASGNANTLDDYEEGTWTPTLRGGTTAGTTTYGVQRGGYIKIGSMVTVFCDMGVSATTGTGTLTIGGFPFTSINDVNFFSVGGLMAEDLNWGGGTYLQLWKNNNTTDAFIYYMTDNSGWVAQQITNESQAYVFTVTYRAA